MDSYFIGVSWAAHVIRLAVFKRNGSLTLTHLVRLPVASSDSSDITNVISQWLKGHIPVNTPVSVVLTLPESLVYLKEVDVPKGTPAEVTQALHWELLNKSATFPKDAILAWQYQKSTVHKVMAIALKEMESVSFESTLHMSGLRVAAIEPDTISLRRSMAFPEDICLLVNIEANQAFLVITEGSVPQFATEVELIQSKAAGEAGHVTSGALSGLITKVKETIQFWQNKSGKTIAHIILSGDGSAAAATRQAIKKSLNLEPTPIKLIAPKGISMAKYTEHTRIEFAGVIGAALRLTSYRYDEDINFLSPKSKKKIVEETNKHQVTQVLWQLVRINAALCVFLIALWIGSVLLANSYQRQIAQNQQFIANHPAQKLIPEVATANKETAAIRSLIASQQDVGARLAFFSANTPLGITYTTLKLTNETQGDWVLDGNGGRTSILAFYDSLSRQATGAAVSLAYSSLSKEKDAVFHIHLLW